MGLFDNVSAADPDPIKEREAKRAAEDAVRAKAAHELLLQVGRDAAAVLLRERVPSHLTAKVLPRGKGARPEIAWDFGNFWIDGTGRYLKRRWDYVKTARFTPWEGTKSRDFLEYVESVGALGYWFDMFDPIPHRNDYDDHRALTTDVEINLRHILKGEPAEQFPRYS